MRKAQVEIISVVLIVLIAISLTGTALLWGLPLIQKKQDQALVERAFNNFNKDNVNSLTKKIEFVAKNGGEETFSLNIDGMWVLYTCADKDNTGNPISGCSGSGPENNSIQFTLFSKSTNVAVGQGWVPLTTTNTNPVGLIGDDPSIVFGKADSLADGYNVIFKTWFRQLNENSEKGQKILLIQKTGSPLTSTENTVRISRGEIKSVTAESGQTLIVTEIKISFG